MATRILVQSRQFCDIETTVFADIDRYFRQCTDTLFVTKKGEIVGIIDHPTYLKHFHNFMPADCDIQDIVNYDFTYIYEDELRQADGLFFSKGISSIPVFNRNKKPLYILKQTHYHNCQGFYCSCLAGLALYNFSVNADLSVSCHCVLRDAGELGNLKNSSLKEIWYSDRANSMRENLRNGCLPTEQCLSCPELKTGPESLCEYYKDNYSFPKGLMIENTSVCNLRCKNCYNAVIKKDTIAVEEIEKIASQLSEHDIEQIFLFKYGETFTDKEIGTKIDIIKKHLPNVKIMVSSNGMLLDRKEAHEAALKLDNLTISLDGTDDEMVEKFQKGSNFTKVSENIKSLITDRQGTSPRITWKIVMFSWNNSNDMINTAFEKAIDIGFDQLQFVDGWNVKPEEKTNAVFESKAFLKFMKMYEFTFSGSGGGCFTFDLKKPKI